MLEWTGERYIPTAKPEEVGAEIHYEHLHRYYFAAQFVKGKVVLDLGCGEGYGSYILSKYAKKVVGVDIDDKSIKHASSTYIRSNLEYRVGSVTSIPVDGEEIFDAVICFEVLEHIAEHEEMLQEVKRVLKKDGIFVVSTPNKKVYSDEPNYQNPFHVKELYFDEFKALLGRYFKHIYFFGQRVYPSSQIWCLTEDNDRSSEFVIERGERSFVRVEAERKEPMYFIAIASDSPLKEIDYRSYLTDVSSVLINNFRKYIRHLEKRLRELEVEVGRLNSIVEQKERQIGDLSASLDKLNTEVAEKSGRVYELENALKIKDGELSRLQQEIESLRSAVRDREAEIERLNDELERISGELKDKNEQVSQLTRSLEEKTKELNEFKVKSINLEQKIRGLEGELKEKESLVGKLRRELDEKEKMIGELQQESQKVKSEIAAKDEQIKSLTEENIRLSGELDSIKSSVTWRAVMKWHSFVERVAPLGTRRRRWYDLGIKGLRILASDGFRTLLRAYREYQATEKHSTHEIKTENLPNPEVLPATEITNEIENIKEENLKSNIEKYNKTLLNIFLAKNNAKVKFPEFNEVVVSIIIPVYNKAEYTFMCLQSILANTSDVPYEVIIVDNGSNDLTPHLLERLENAKVIRNEDNLGFIKACNQGANVAAGKYLLFLNNDTFVTPNWLSTLVKTIENYPTCGAVGCKLVYPDGKLQEAGSIIWADGSCLGYGREDDPFKPEYSYVREVDYSSAACLLVRKDLFEKLGGFDERYLPAYYEDSDLCMGIWDLGYKVVYQPSTTIIHFEFTSSGSFEKAKEYMEKNKAKFVAKWNDRLANHFPPSATNVLYARDKREGARILVLDDRIPNLNQGSGYPRMYYLVKFLAELEYKVTFYPLDNPTPWQPYTDNLQQLGVEVFYGGYASDFVKFASERAGYYDIVLISRPHNMGKVYDIVKRAFPNATLIYDAEALFSIREILKAKVRGQRLNKSEEEKMIMKEIELMKLADVVITVSEREKELIKEHGNINNVFVWGHPISPRPTENSFEDRRDLLFVGGFLAPDSPNEDAVLYFVKSIFPKVKKKIDCKLYIVGINPPESVRKLSSEDVIVTGYVEDLSEYYNKCRIFVVPHRFAAGIPWKLQEAMSCCIPAVVTELIASQLSLEDGVEVMVGRDPQDFAEKVVKLYSNKDLWVKVRNNGLKYIQEECNPEKLKEELNKIIITQAQRGENS